METTTRYHILIESHQLLMQAREDNYTVDQLATDMRRSKKTIYKLFGSKNMLIKAVIVKHMEHVIKEFQNIEKQDLNDMDKLIHYIYAVDETLLEIRLSRWYQQAKSYVQLKQEYFEVRTNIFDQFVNNGLVPFKTNFEKCGKSSEDLTSFIISSLEFNYFGRTVAEVKKDKPYQYVDQIIFLLHGRLTQIHNV